MRKFQGVTKVPLVVNNFHQCAIHKTLSTCVVVGLTSNLISECIKLFPPQMSAHSCMSSYDAWMPGQTESLTTAVLSALMIKTRCILHPIQTIRNIINPCQYGPLELLIGREGGQKTLLYGKNHCCGHIQFCCLKLKQGMSKMNFKLFVEFDILLLLAIHNIFHVLNDTDPFHQAFNFWRK